MNVTLLIVVIGVLGLLAATTAFLLGRRSTGRLERSVLLGMAIYFFLQSLILFYAASRVH